MRVIFAMASMVVLGSSVFAETASTPPKQALCESANALVRSIPPEQRPAMAIDGVEPSNQTYFFDGWKDAGRAGILFDTRRSSVSADPAGAKPVTGPWSGSDVQVMSPSPDVRRPLHLFVQSHQAGAYQNAADEGTDGGFFQVTEKEKIAGGGVACPSDHDAYDVNFFPTPDGRGADLGVSTGSVYCIRTRDGLRFALIRVDAVCDRGVVLSYRYNGSSAKFGPALVAVPPAR